jgi:hypothetical protein
LSGLKSAGVPRQSENYKRKEGRRPKERKRETKKENPNGETKEK